MITELPAPRFRTARAMECATGFRSYVVLGTGSSVAVKRVAKSISITMEYPSLHINIKVSVKFIKTSLFFMDDRTNQGTALSAAIGQAVCAFSIK